MASKPKQPAGPPMTLGNMRHLGVQGLIASCPNPPCRHEGPIDVSKFADDVELPSFASEVVCAKPSAAAAGRAPYGST
jgi:hypothetical protein